MARQPVLLTFAEDWRLPMVAEGHADIDRVVTRNEPSAITSVDTATDTSAPASKLARDLVPFSGDKGWRFVNN